MSRTDVAAIAAAILFLVFIAYEIAGGSSYKWAANWHTVSYFAQQHELLKWFLFVAPPAVYQLWWLWHLSHHIAK